MLRVVLATNQYVSGLIVREGVPGQLLEAWHHGAFTLLTSQAILAEARRVFLYPRIRKKYRLSDEDIAVYLAEIEKGAVLTPGALTLSVVEDDPDDDQILVCAIEGDADYIVSGDPHLLNLNSYRKIKIVTARRCLSILGEL